MTYTQILQEIRKLPAGSVRAELMRCWRLNEDSESDAAAIEGFEVCVKQSRLSDWLKVVA